MWRKQNAQQKMIRNATIVHRRLVWLAKVKNSTTQKEIKSGIISLPKQAKLFVGPELKITLLSLKAKGHSAKVKVTKIFSQLSLSVSWGIV